jgi:hypothetical protein
MTNIHAFGAALQNRVRPAVAGHRIYLRRGIGTGARYSEPFQASSGPIAQRLVPNAGGVEFSEHDRSFFWEITATKQFGLPKKGDVIVDLKDGTQWRIVPDDREAAWHWHDQNKTSIQVNTKRDS